MTTSRTRPVVSTAMWRLRPLTFLAASQPRLALGHGVGGAHGLGIDDRGGGLGLAPGRGPDLGAQLGVQPGQGAVIAPGGEVPVDGLPGREVSGQIPPGASGAVQVQDRLDDPPRRPDPRPAPPPGHDRRAGARRSPATGHRSGHWDSPWARPARRVPWARAGPGVSLIVTHRDHGARAWHLSPATHHQPSPPGPAQHDLSDAHLARDGHGPGS